MRKALSVLSFASSSPFYYARAPAPGVPRLLSLGSQDEIARINQPVDRPFGRWPMHCCTNSLWPVCPCGTPLSMASCSHFSNEAVVGAALRLAAEAGTAKLTAKTAATASVMIRIISSVTICGAPDAHLFSMQAECNLNGVR